MNFSITKAEPQDAEEINVVLKKAFKEYEKVSCPAAAKGALSESIEKTIEDIENKLFLKAVIDDKISGSVRVELTDNDTAYLSRFSVLPEHQKFGIGKKLLDEVFSRIKKTGARRIYLYTSLEVGHLINFYESCGFKVESVSEDRGYKRAKLIKDLW